MNAVYTRTEKSAFTTFLAQAQQEGVFVAFGIAFFKELRDTLHCHCCGTSVASAITACSSRKIGSVAKLIDRKTSSIGHTHANSVVSCRDCFRMNVDPLFYEVTLLIGAAKKGDPTELIRLYKKNEKLIRQWQYSLMDDYNSF